VPVDISVYLGIIAFALLVMAAVQVGVVIVLLRLARRVDVLATRVETELGPLAERLLAVAANLQQASSLAAVQVERVDRMLASVTRRAEDTMGVVQHAVVGPIREVMGVIAGVRGVMGAFRAFRGGEAPRSPSRFDEEDPLFIG
jgi:hypothetical protein